MMKNMWPPASFPESHLSSCVHLRNYVLVSDIYVSVVGSGLEAGINVTLGYLVQQVSYVNSSVQWIKSQLSSVKNIVDDVWDVVDSIYSKVKKILDKIP